MKATTLWKVWGKPVMSFPSFSQKKEMKKKSYTYWNEKVKRLSLSFRVLLEFLSQASSVEDIKSPCLFELSRSKSRSACVSGSGCIWVWLCSQKQPSVTSNPHPHHQGQKGKLQLVSLAENTTARRRRKLHAPRRFPVLLLLRYIFSE